MSRDESRADSSILSQSENRQPVEAKQHRQGEGHFSGRRALVTLVFTGKNLYRTLETGVSCSMAKDTVYRFLNSVHTNWRRFLLLFCSRVIGQELELLTGAATIFRPWA
jgi:hypothetical protein